MEVFAKSNKIRVVMDSQLMTGVQVCEEYYNLRFNHNLVPLTGMGRPIEMGRLMHHMMEAFYLGRKDHKSRQDCIQAGMAAAELYIKGCADCVTETCKVHIKDAFCGLESITLEQAQEVINTFLQYQERWKNDSWATIAVEHVLGKVIYEDDDISLLWKAKIDWLADNNEGIYSVDHKTMSRREETLTLNNQFIGQCVLTDQTRMFINKIGFQTSLKPEEKFERPAINYTRDRMAEWVMEAASYAYDLAMLHETGRYRHKFTSCSRKYGDCLYRKVCEGQPNDRERLIRDQFRTAKKWDVVND